MPEVIALKIQSHIRVLELCRHCLILINIFHVQGIFFKTGGTSSSLKEEFTISYIQADSLPIFHVMRCNQEDMWSVVVI